MYRERLTLPWGYHLALVALGASVVVAVGAALGTVAAAIALVVTAAALAALLRVWTGEVSVVDGELHAGRATLPAWARGEVEVLDAGAARRVIGVGADARAHLYLRSWVATAVWVEVTDPADPTPYWYVSTRHPDRLAALLTATPSEGSH